MEINHDTHVNAWLVPSWVRNPAKYYDNIRPVETFVRPVGYRVIFPAEQGSNTEVTPQTIGIPPEHAKSIHSTSAPRSQSAGSTGTLQEKRQGRQDPIACSVPPLRLHAGQCIPSRGPSTTQGVTDSPAHLSRSQAEKVTGSSQKISLIVTEHPAIPPQLAKRKREDGTGYGNIGQDAPTRPNKVRVLDSQIGSSGTAQTFPVPAPVPAQYITQESSATPQCLDPNTVAALDQDYRKELSSGSPCLSGHSRRSPQITSRSAGHAVQCRNGQGVFRKCTCDKRGGAPTAGSVQLLAHYSEHQLSRGNG
ncbi:hypothetical protein K474DRAFT_638859 [Panus rudis PR-1116 ss-1]|nr:hypothetical protein K474DRAFT_638859 [Panus rudis PR-1116 ss-1]